MDDRHDLPIQVEILDTLTGQKAPSDYPFSTYWWMDGNGSCDCNRRILFNVGHDPTGYCVGCHRYLITKVEPLLDGYTLRDFNRGYPDELLERYL